MSENALRDALASGKVTIVIGARQVGKTTLVNGCISRDCRHAGDPGYFP